MGRKLIDLSHTIENGMVTYKGFPAPLICDYLTREESRSNSSGGTEFYIGKIEMIANTGTYVDSPYHRYADGIDVSELPLTSLADLEGVVIRAQHLGRAISAKAFSGMDVKGKAVLVHTDWAHHWGTDQYFENHVFLTRDAAEFLVEKGAAFVGVDTYNIDDTNDGLRPVHTTLLGNRIPICEHMCGLNELPDRGFRFHAAPVKVRAMGTFPVRAYAVQEK